MSGYPLQTFLYCDDIRNQGESNGKRETGYQIWGFMKGIRKPQEILKLKVLYMHVRSQDIVAVN